MPPFPAKSLSLRRTVAFIVFEKTKLLDVAGPLQVFNDAILPNGISAYDVVLISETGGRVGTDTVCDLNTLQFRESPTLDWDTVLISGGEAAKLAMQSTSLQNKISKAAGSCRRLGSICLGAFILAKGGFLDGRSATTHWEGCRDLAAQFPDVQVDENAIFVEDRGVWTSAGVTAGIDMAIEMVRRDLGAAEALRLAKALVLPAMRSGGQRQFGTALAAQATSKGNRFAGLMASLAANLEKKYSVSDMAAEVGMSERNFSRQFSSDVGYSPAQFVEKARVDCAASLLHRTDITLATAQQKAGFSNDEHMRRAFQRQLGVSPSAYAAQFATPAR